MSDEPLSPLGQMVFEQAKAFADVAQEAHRQGKSESEKRIAHLEAKVRKFGAALEECLEYFESHYDVVDGDYGAPAPNREMLMGQMIEEALGRRP